MVFRYNPAMASRNPEVRPSVIKWSSKERQLVEHFTDHPGEWFSRDYLQSLKLWKGKSLDGRLVNYVKYVRKDLLPPAGIVSIEGEAGYVYFFAVEPSQRIEPEGYRPVPIRNIPQNLRLHELFAGLRFATITEDVCVARPVISAQRYKLLVMLAKSRLEQAGVSTLRMVKELGLRPDGVREIREILKADLERLTDEWTLVHPEPDRTTSLKWDMTYLVNVHEHIQFKAPNGRPNPQSSTENSILVL